jgi:hypothetical protein
MQFKWESQEQEQGYYNFIQFLRKNGIKKTPNLSQYFLLAVYFIQKDHESNVFWTELVGNQISSLQNEIMGLKDQIQKLERANHR